MTVGKRSARLAATAASLTLIAALSGCDNLARSQGKFPVASTFGAGAIHPEGNPLNELLWVPALDKDGKVTSEKTPLVRVAYRDPFSGRLKNPAGLTELEYKRQSYYMVIDVTNVIRDPQLGSAGNNAQYRQRLRLIAEMLVAAADWNGDVYWRHLTTFLETQKAARSASQAALGSSIAASFINPVLGASLAGGALTIDTFVEDYTSSLDVDDYAKLREAAALKRRSKRDELFEAVQSASGGTGSLDRVLQLSYDYAFTYSIKGALQAAGETKEQLEQFLITGESSWAAYFDDEIRRHKVSQLLAGKLSAQEAEKVQQAYQADIENEKAELQAQRDIAAQERQKRVAEAETERLKAEQMRYEQQMLTDKAKAAADTKRDDNASDDEGETDQD